MLAYSIKGEVFSERDLSVHIWGLPYMSPQGILIRVCVNTILGGYNLPQYLVNDCMTPSPPGVKVI